MTAAISKIQSLQDTSKPYRLVERTLLCQEKVFIPLLVKNNFLTELEQSLLEHFFTMVKNHEGVVADIIVYLRTSPKIALTRIQKRNRQGEEDLSLDYLTKLHSYYDKWLLTLIKGACQLLANEGHIGDFSPTKTALLEKILQCPA